MDKERAKEREPALAKEQRNRCKAIANGTSAHLIPQDFDCSFPSDNQRPCSARGD